ncbi:hypothetical protein [Sphingobium sp. CCH11-B1]|jgi:hypothetical protein|uniref:hypothetical protein n=1 Tax=Sphingobium sp. CCH11-B1 TaxID=1768781 RepID=UPI001E340194|nr:hypothetical protein [Sphingobium sp. CCH11-B1]
MVTPAYGGNRLFVVNLLRRMRVSGLKEFVEMATRSSKAWFAAKRYGYGSGLPISWEGWAVLAAFFLVVVVAAAELPGWKKSIVDAPAIIALIAICALKTEGGWRWRWGDRSL